MFIRLSNGKEMRVGCRHSKVKEGLPRKTTVFLKDVESENVLEAQAVCSLEDNFEKRTGRILAAMRLNAALRAVGFEKQDRRLIFEAVCPDLKKKRKR